MDGLDAKAVAKVGLETGVASNREVDGTTLLRGDRIGRAVDVETVGFSQKLALDTTLDSERVISGELERCPTATTLRVEHISKLRGSELSS